MTRSQWLLYPLVGLAALTVLVAAWYGYDRVGLMALLSALPLC